MCTDIFNGLVLKEVNWLVNRGIELSFWGSLKGIWIYQSGILEFKLGILNKLEGDPWSLSFPG